MPAPNFRNHRVYLLGLFQVLLERGASDPGDIYDAVADRVGVPAEFRLEKTARGEGNPVYKNRIQFARQSLVDAGLLIGSDDSRWRRSVWELSPEGVSLGRSGLSPSRLETAINEKATEGARRRNRERSESIELAGIGTDQTNVAPVDEEQSSQSVGAPSAPDFATPEEVRSIVDAANQNAMAVMLEHVRAMSDRAFEYLVGSVLKAALKAETVSITQKSRDGGFDGLLTFDSLGIRVAVFEAKRYEDGNVVGRPLIDAFATAARRRRATHSLFVTSSRFSKEAIEAARDEAVRLVDGVAFVELMAKHGVGLRAREQFTLYEIDPAWSVDDEFGI